MNGYIGPINLIFWHFLSDALMVEIKDFNYVFFAESINLSIIISERESNRFSFAFNRLRK